MMKIGFFISRLHWRRLIYDALITADALDATLTQLHNLRAVFEGGEAVGDDEQSKVFAEALDGFHDGLFGFVV